MAKNIESAYVVNLMKTIAASDYMRDITLVAGEDAQRYIFTKYQFR